MTPGDGMSNIGRLSEVSCIYLVNALNEVLHGFSVDYVQALGTAQSKIFELFQKLTALCQESGFGLEKLSVAEVQLLLKCSKLCLAEIDAQEFATRLGESAETALKVNDQLSRYIEGFSLLSAGPNV